MTDPARGPTTEELRARVLAQTSEGDPTVVRSPDSRAESQAGLTGPSGSPTSPSGRVLPRPCLACNREQGERMCDLCQRLEIAEAAAPPLDLLERSDALPALDERRAEHLGSAL